MNNFQIILKVLILSTILFYFSCSAEPEIFQGNNNELTIEGIAQNRDITQYDQGGHFWCSLRPYGNEEDRLNGEKKVRDFIWQHWSERKHGYIVLSCAGVDTLSTTHYFIEPNGSDEWGVTRIHIYQHTLPEYNNVPIPISDEFLTIERVEAKSEKDNWRLISKTKDGKEVDRLPIF